MGPNIQPYPLQPFMDANNQYALITGASLGIGREIAREFAQRKINTLLVALDTPERLKSMVGKDIISVKTDDTTKAAEEIRLRYQVEARYDGDGLTFEVDNGEEFLPIFIKEFGTRIVSVSLRHPSLDDVFLKLTGREMREEEVSDTFKAMVRQHGRRMRR